MTTGTRATYPLAGAVAAFTALTIIGTATPGQAQQTGAVICGQRDQVVSQLETRFGESVRSIGLAQQNRIVEVYASEETGSWTIAVTSVNGTTCLMASGQHFETFAPILPGAPT